MMTLRRCSTLPTRTRMTNYLTKNLRCVSKYKVLNLKNLINCVYCLFKLNHFIPIFFLETLVSFSLVGDDEASDSSWSLKAPHYRHRNATSTIFTSSHFQTRIPVQLCLTNTACIQGDILLPKLLGKLQTRLWEICGGDQNWICHILLNQHCQPLERKSLALSILSTLLI